MTSKRKMKKMFKETASLVYEQIFSKNEINKICNNALNTIIERHYVIINAPYQERQIFISKFKEIK